ncbi:maleylpyruvate isomerase family mycothiol-dependent enzyme [Nocardioides sp.]|uniref:maleylpyruvate isomerase family mycothiol-dependent enzyme n=1 Tax=Nocardioides sp. TaxID=35761 RepID=UPI003515E4DC
MVSSDGPEGTPRPGLTPTERAAIIEAESARLGAVVADLDPATPVPTCPDWTVRDLLHHVVQVHDFWAAVIGRRLDDAGVERYQEERAALPQDVPALLDARERATADLLTALAGRAPDEPAWSWFPADQSVGFTWRMQTHEVTLHRVDAELAAGLAPSSGPGLAPEAAADGVDHVAEVMWAWAPPEVERRVTGRVDLVATDTGRRWRLETLRWSGEAWGQTFTEHPAARLAVDGASARPADVTLLGPAAALDLHVWTRDSGEAGALVSEGAAHVLAEFRAVLADGIA